MTCFVECNEFIFVLCFNDNRGELMDHIETIFNEMIEDINLVKLSTYFKSATR